ncbi:MAG: thioredoxin family protein [Anaerolineae bacterium]|nr:thioredoxin family protein [Anaerolineae bacterium]
MRPIVHGLEAEYWGRVDFVYLDRDDPANDDLEWRYGVYGQPTFLVLTRDGTVIWRWYGSPTEAALRAALALVTAG